MQQDDGCVTGFRLGGELDVGEHPVRVRVGDEQRPAFARGLGCEAVSVDESNARFDGVDRQRGPCRIEERHRGFRLHLDATFRRAFAQQVNAAFENERRARHRVENLPRFVRRAQQFVGDVSVDLVERGGRVVRVVERRRTSGCVEHERGRRMSRRAQEASTDTLDRGERRRRHETGIARAQSDDDDGGHRRSRVSPRRWCRSPSPSVHRPGRR